MRPDVYECRRADRDQDMGPQSAAALPLLALRPNKAAEHKRGEETDKRIEEIADSEGVQEGHNPRPPVSKLAYRISDAQRSKTRPYCSEPISLASVDDLQETLACATLTRPFETP
jgi:hypothetical protein